MSKARVISVGVATHDIVMGLDQFPTGGGKYRAKEVVQVGGGMAANAAVAIARLGGTASLVARLGQDAFGDLIVKDLKKEGVSCELVQQFSGVTTSFSSVYVDATGERQLVNYRDPDLPSSPDWFIEALPEFDVIMTDPRWPEGAYAAMAEGRKADKPGVLDAEAPALEAKDAFMTASHVVFSADGLRDYANTDDLPHALETAYRHRVGFVGVTDGPNGVLWLDGGEVQHFPAFDLTAVDTLGAGDVWHGAFALALGEKQSEKDAIRFASATAALKCLRVGGRTGAPSRTEVEQFLKSA